MSLCQPPLVEEVVFEISMVRPAIPCSRMSSKEFVIGGLIGARWWNLGQQRKR